MKKNTLLILALLFILHNNYLLGQGLSESSFYLKKELKNILKSDYFVDSTKSVEIAFTFKIDSLGEIHSAHIRRIKNINNDLSIYFFICYDIEKKINILDVSNIYKNSFLYDKFILINYVYRSEE